MKILLWVVLIFFMVNWFIRIFRKEIMLGIGKFIAKRVAKSMSNEQRAYQRHHETGYFEESVFYDEKIHITSPKNKAKREIKVDDIAEDADFEEIK